MDVFRWLQGDLNAIDDDATSLVTPASSPSLMCWSILFFIIYIFSSRLSPAPCQPYHSQSEKQAHNFSLH